jgi:hypothetical protein
VKRHWIVRRWRLARRFQAAVSRRSIGRFGMRRLPMHSRTSKPMAISAWFSQLACLGV